MLNKNIVLIFIQIFSFFDSKAEGYKLEVNDDINITSTLGNSTPTCSPGPIDVDTEQAMYSILESEITYHHSIYRELRLKNTGYGVTMTPTKNETGCIVSGGALGNKQYTLHEVEFLWTEEGTGSSGATIDGEGEPLQAAFKFVEMTKRIEYLIGFVGIKVEDTNGKNNSRFDAIRENGFNKIKTPGSEVILNHLEAVSLLILEAGLQDYYFYYADIKFKTGPLYKCANVLQLKSDPERTISFEEYQSLLNLELYDSSRSNTIGVLPNDGRSVKQCTGIQGNIDNFVYTGIPEEIKIEL